MTEPAKPVLPEEELEAALELPAPFCNKTYLMLTPITARIVFAEIRTQQSKPHIRAAVCMSISDLIALRDVITRTVEGQTETVTVEKAKANG